MRKGLLATLAVAAGVLVFGVPVASAHNGSATATCSNATFTYTGGFGPGDHYIQETVYIDGAKQTPQTIFHFNGDSGGPSVVPISVPNDGNSHQIKLDAYEGSTRVNGFAVYQTVGPCHPPSTCPPGKKLNFRWHYSANGTSGSWSGTKSAFCPQPITMGPQAMEGNLQVAPGAILKAGYSFTSPGNNASFFVNVSSAQVVFPYTCVSGGGSPGSLTVTMTDQTYHVTNSQWYPTGDQHSPLVYQGQIVVPNVCNGGKLRFQRGGTFTANVS